MPKFSLGTEELRERVQRLLMAIKPVCVDEVKDLSESDAIIVLTGMAAVMVRTGADMGIVAEFEGDN